jgi:hypothetical protein
MNNHQEKVARSCLDGSERNTMTFPQIVGTLMEAGFESYAIDFRRAIATYYLPEGGSIELPTHKADATVAPKIRRRTHAGGYQRSATASAWLYL